MSFECNNCGEMFGDFSIFSYHINNQICPGKKFFCDYCGKGFAKKNSMYHHSKKCKERGETKDNDDIRVRLARLEKENDDLKKKVVKLEINDGKGEQ